jgi:nucleoside-diphosphate-sugar epimerase
VRVLVIGGSGVVGSLIVPHLKEQHDLRVYDLRQPDDTSLEFVAGDVTDYEALVAAAEGVDALIYMAMGHLDWDTPVGFTSGFDVNVKGLHLALRAAHANGVKHAVFTSTMSIYEGKLEARYFPDEDITPDAFRLYGFTKYLGEQVCQAAVREWGMDVNALRLCHPTPEDRWLEQTVEGTPTIATTGHDVARAVLAALDYRAGFQPFMISGDYENKIMNMAKAKRYLGWEPLARPTRKE